MLDIFLLIHVNIDFFFHRAKEEEKRKKKEEQLKLEEEKKKAEEEKVRIIIYSSTVADTQLLLCRSKEVMPREGTVNYLQSQGSVLPLARFARFLQVLMVPKRPHGLIAPFLSLEKCQI